MGRGRKVRVHKYEPVETAAVIDQLRRISILLGLAAVKGEGQTSKVLTLTAAGFKTAEVARLLHITPNNVRVIVHRGRRSSLSRQAAKRPEQSE